MRIVISFLKESLKNLIFQELIKKYKNVASKLNGKTIYLDEYRHNNTIKSMEDAKSRLNKTNEKLKNTLDMYLKDGIKDSTKEVIVESQKDMPL